MDCPYRDETTDDPSRTTILQSRQVLNNVASKSKDEMDQQGSGTQKLMSGETEVSSWPRHSGMGVGLPEENRASQVVIPADTTAGRTGGGRTRTRRTANAECEFQLSLKTIVGTRAASCTHNAGMQRRKWILRRTV